MSVENKTRVPNFSKSETELLTSLVRQYSHILENKKSDMTNNQLKEQTWSKLAKEFNSLSSFVFRSDKTLRAKYDNIKKRAKTKYSTFRRSLYGTGGGPSAEINFSQEEEVVMELSGTSVMGLPSRNDCDEIVITKETKEKYAETSQDTALPAKNNQNILIDEKINESETPKNNNFLLKRKISTPLTKKNPEVFNKTMNNYSALANKKIKLMDAQMDNFNKKQQQETKEHELRCTLLQLEIDIKKSTR